MSIFGGIAGALGGNSGSRVIQSIIERITRKKENLNPYRVKGKGDPGYTAPALEQAGEQPGASSVDNSLLVSADKRRSARQGVNNFTAGSAGVQSDYVPNLLRPKKISDITGLKQHFATGAIFADGTASNRANQIAQGVTRFDGEQFAARESRDLRGFNETNVPPASSSLVQPFSQPAQQSANQIFGDLFARQNAVGAPMMFKINK